MNRSIALGLLGIGTATVILAAFFAAGPNENSPHPPANLNSKNAAKTVDIGSSSASTKAGKSDDTSIFPESSERTPAVPGPSPTPPPSQEAILAAIEEAATTYDPSELPKIQPYLTHPDPDVRAAALNGILVLGDEAGAPLLRAAAKLTADPREAVQFLESADYLELPSLPAPVLKQILKKTAPAASKP